mmetsp:Transcript_118598/g.382905  ORF Transcript_118598/g.382905 Transcript_118598/m.382905 type:complete len:248 (+) Transcript_118598:279-1022(+)
MVRFFSPPVEPEPPVPHARRLPLGLKPNEVTACVAKPNVFVQTWCFGSQSVTRQSPPPVAMCLPSGSAAKEMVVYWWATTAVEPSFCSEGVGKMWIFPGVPPVAIQRVSPSVVQTIWFTSCCMFLDAPNRRLPDDRRSSKYTWSERLLTAMCFESGDQQRTRNSFIELDVFFSSTSKMPAEAERVSKTRNLPPQDTAAAMCGEFGSHCMLIHSPGQLRSSSARSGSYSRSALSFVAIRSLSPAQSRA